MSSILKRELSTMSLSLPNATLLPALMVCRTHEPDIHMWKVRSIGLDLTPKSINVTNSCVMTCSLSETDFAFPLASASVCIRVPVLPCFVKAL